MVLIAVYYFNHHPLETSAIIHLRFNSCGPHQKTELVGHHLTQTGVIAHHTYCFNRINVIPENTGPTIFGLVLHIDYTGFMK